MRYIFESTVVLVAYSAIIIGCNPLNCWRTSNWYNVIKSGRPLLLDGRIVSFIQVVKELTIQIYCWTGLPVNIVLVLLVQSFTYSPPPQANLQFLNGDCARCATFWSLKTTGSIQDSVCSAKVWGFSEVNDFSAAKLLKILLCDSWLHFSRTFIRKLVVFINVRFSGNGVGKIGGQYLHHSNR